MSRVSDQERFRRVEEEGSRRQRDLAGHRRVLAARATQRSRRLAKLADPLPLAAAEAWAAVLDRLRASVPASTFDLWLAPLRAVAALDDTLYLAAPEGKGAWVERRYSMLIAAALTDVTDFSQISFASGWARS